MPLKDQIFIGGVWADTDVRSTNTTGTPLTSAVASNSGEALADIYTLTFSAVTPGVSATVTVATNSANNPYKGRVKVVVLDNATIHADVVPGVNLVFSNSGGFLATWAAQVLIGSFLGVFDAFGAGAGVPSAGVRHQVTNTGTGAASACKATLPKQAIQYKQTGRALLLVKPFAVGATEKATGARVMPYNVTVINVAGAGPAKTCDLQIDGVTPGAGAIRDLATNAAVSGVGLKAIAGQSYLFLTGALTGVEFQVDPACATGDEANVLIFNQRFIEIAPDVAGVEGAYGTADVTLTQVGQAVGTILAAGVAYYWIRAVVASGGNASSNPHPGNVAVTGVESEAAGWTA